MKLNILNMGLLLKEEESHEIIHYKNYSSLKCLIENKKPNLIIHGVSNAGKTYLIEYILKKVFGGYRDVSEDKYSFKANSNYYIFDFNNHLKHIIIKKINSIVKNYDHFNDTIKYIVIDNYNNIPDLIQKNMKVFMEKYSDTSRFILLTNKLFSIDPSLRNGCFNIRIHEPTKYDKFIYFKHLLEKYSVKYNGFLLLKNCEKYDIDHIARIYYDYDIKYHNIYERINGDIYKIMNSVFTIDEIKTLSMNIKELNLDISKIFSSFFKKNPYSDSKNKLIIKEITHYNYIIKKAYRDIISIEALLIKIYHILHYG